MSKSAGWKAALCNLALHVSSVSGEASCKLLYAVTYFTTTLLSCVHTAVRPM